MKILVVDDDPNIIELNSLLIKGLFPEAEISKAGNPKEAINFFLEGINFNLVLSDFDMPPHGTGEEVYNYLKVNNYQGSFVLITSRGKDEIKFMQTDSWAKSEKHSYIQKPSSAEEFSQTIGKVIFSDGATSSKNLDYKPVSINHFLRFDKAVCNIYLRLAENKHVKIINAQDKYELGFIEKYIGKGINQLYLEPSDFSQFADSLGKSSFLKIDSQSATSVYESTKKAHYYINSMVQNYGLDPHSLRISEKICTDSLKSIEGMEFANILKNLMKTNDFAYDHIYLTSVFCIEILRKMNIEHEELFKELTLASFLHDIHLNTSNVIICHDLHPEKIDDLSPEEQALIKGHHKVLDNFKFSDDFTGRVNQIIRYHHETDENYPHRLKMPLSRLGLAPSVFVVSHCLAVESFRYNFDKNKIRDQLSTIFLRFDSENFIKILQEITSVF